MLRSYRKNVQGIAFSRIVLDSASLLLVLTIVSGSVLSSSYVSADESVVDEISITVPVSCTMSGTGQNSHNAEIANGTYQANIGTTTLHAFCNDAEGFAIYAAGYTGNEIGGTNSNKLVGTSASGNAVIETGLATTAGNPDVSNWAMKLAMAQDSGDTTGTNAFTIDNGFNSYHVVPNEYVKVAYKNSNTDMTASTGGVKLTTTYAAYISKTQPADTYSGQVKYTLVHPSDAEAPLSPQQATAGCINYFANASNAVGTMGCQSATDGNTITLLASNFSRTGYGFAGWSDKYDYATNQNAHFYGPQEDITVPIGTTANGLSLYAVWVSSAGSLQDSSKVSQLCGTGTGSLTTAPTDGTANLSSVSALTDQRDNETYAIAKLADGNCWMIENLRLESTASHNSDGTLAQGYGTSTTYGNFSGLADAEPAWENNLTTSNSLYYSLYTITPQGTATINIGTGDETGERFPRYNNVNTPTAISDRPQNPTTNSATNSTSNAGMYSYGNYYTWHAAIADTTEYYYGGDHNTTSICPTGWSIPLGDFSTGDLEQEASDPANRVGSFSYLDRKMGGTGRYQYTTAAALRWRKYPVNFVYSGYINGGSVGNRGSYGYSWSSTASTTSSSKASNLQVGSSFVGPGISGGSGNYKSCGKTIRCLIPGA